MTTAPPFAPDLRDLLTIDVASELRKLGQAQLQGPWQLPAELVRRAIRTGASRVWVTFRGQAVVVEDDGAGFDARVLADLAVLLDGDRLAQARHLALAQLEQAGELALVALASLSGLRELVVDSVGPNGAHRLAFCPGRRPSLGPSVAPGSTDSRTKTRVTVRAPALGDRRARRWLADVGRFSALPIELDGAPIGDGFSGSVLEAPLAPPFRGRVAFLPEGDSAEIHLLVCGLVVAQFAIPGALAFTAAVELGPTVRELGAARLREAYLPHCPALVGAALAVLADGAPRIAGQSERVRSRLGRLVLRAAAQPGDAPGIQRIAVFRAMHAGRQLLVDLATLRASLAPDGVGGRRLWALPAGQSPDRYVLPAGPVLIADEAERSALADILGVPLAIPPRRASPRSIGSLVRGGVRVAGAAWGRMVGFLGAPFAARPLPECALSPSERAFLHGLRAELATRPGMARDVVLCSGRGPLRRRGGRRAALFLPRENPLVVASVRAFGTDPGWMRLIHLGLSFGPSRSPHRAQVSRRS